MKKMITAAVMIAFMSGCAPSNNIVSTRSSSSASPNAVGIRQEMHDMVAAANLKLGEVRMVRTQGGVLKAEVELLNQTSATQRMLYRFEWFDANGNRVESVQSQLLQGIVAPGAIQTISSVAPSEQATDFRLQMLRRE